MLVRFRRALSFAVPSSVDISAAIGSSPLQSREPAKRLFDVVVASLLLLVCLPVLAAVTILLVLSQGGPLFIRHRRIGKDGKAFDCLKFRTMVTDAEQVLQDHLALYPSARLEWQSNRKLRDDPRVTVVGFALRRSSLDELPQLLNVLRGEMSLVGPRPIVEAETVHYGVHVADYIRVRPGLTGLWQVSGRSDTSYATRVQMDVDYVRRQSFARDLLILVKTLPAVVKAQGSC